MITLITGVPGAGKTLYCVDSILSKEAEGSRQVFVDGIPDLQLRHEVAPDPLEWHTWAPDGALIVIDEVQRIWRPAASSAKPLESIAQLETHRHRGLDFVIMTQHPNLLHQNVRRLVGKHIHVRRTSLGVYVYEWSECSNPDSFRTAISKIKWPHPKRSFGLYKSATVHQKVRFRIPGAMKVFIAAVFLVLGLGAYLFDSITARMGLGHKSEPVEVVNTAPAVNGGPVPVVTAAPVDDFTMPNYAHEIYLSGISGYRDDKGEFKGVLLFKVDMGSRVVTMTDDHLVNLGYRVQVPNYDVAILIDPKGRSLSVTFEPTEYSDTFANGRDPETAAPASQPTAADGVAVEVPIDPNLLVSQ